jgi:hypothetical protein
MLLFETYAVQGSHHTSVIFDFFKILIMLHIDLENKTKSKTCFLMHFPSFSVVSCENYILGAQNFQNPLNRVSNFFLLEIGQYGYQKIGNFMLIPKM